MRGGMAGLAAAALLGAALLVAPGDAARDKQRNDSAVADEARCNTRRGDVEICVISANAFGGHHKNDLGDLAAGCLQQKPATQVIVFALQDQKMMSFPDLAPPANISVGGQYFYNRGAAFPGEGAAFQGEVGVAVYSLLEYAASTGSSKAKSWGKTWTTVKGSLVVEVRLGDRSLVIASTHGPEGVRGKKQGKECRGEDPAESERVKLFKHTLKMISKQRRDTETLGVVWAGDFNPRTVEPDGENAGCPIWPGSTDDLENLKRGRDILGTEASELVTFTSLLEDTDLVEAGNLACPTYKKGKKESMGKYSQFSCRDGEDDRPMYYKTSHPPSWADRIFYSKSLGCDGLHRITHKTDHDALFLTCSVDMATV